MALRIAKDRPLPIGVDLGTATVKMAQLRITEQSVELLAANAAEIPLSCRKDLSQRMDFLAQTIPGMLRSWQFKGRSCILAIPAASTFVQHVKMPKLPPAEMDKALKVELHGKLPYPTEDAVIRHIVAGDIYVEGEPRQEVVVIASSRATVEAYLDMAKRAKLDVNGMNIECCAIVECFARLFKRSTDASRVTLYIDIGAASTQVVLSHGDRVAFARNLARGGEQLDQAVSAGLSIAPEQAGAMRRDLAKANSTGGAEDELYRLLEEPLDALALEVTQCLRYYESVFRNSGIERAIFLGGQAHDKRLCQLLAKRINLPAQVGDPLVRVKRIGGAGLSEGLDRREPQPNWAVAVGLSLGAQWAA